MKSQEHENFENLLRKVVSVPHSEVKQRMESDRIAKELAREAGQPMSRTSPIVSPDAVAPSKRAN
jgi:hypothetical protein